MALVNFKIHKLHFHLENVLITYKNIPLSECESGCQVCNSADRCLKCERGYYLKKFYGGASHCLRK